MRFWNRTRCFKQNESVSQCILSPCQSPKYCTLVDQIETCPMSLCGIIHLLQTSNFFPAWESCPEDGVALSGWRVHTCCTLSCPMSPMFVFYSSFYHSCVNMIDIYHVHIFLAFHVCVLAIYKTQISPSVIFTLLSWRDFVFCRGERLIKTLLRGQTLHCGGVQ